MPGSRADPAAPDASGDEAPARIAALEGTHYIRVPSGPADDRTCVLKQGETFGVFDRHGDVWPSGLGEQGLFHDGTRHLSRFELTLGERAPMLLSSTVNDGNDILTVDLTNPDVPDREGGIALPRGSLHLRRTRFLWGGICYERLHLASYAPDSLSLELVLSFGADFADIFEVRGEKRRARGRRSAPLLSEDRCTLGYVGLDGAERRTTLGFAPAPVTLTGERARYWLTLAPHAQAEILVAVCCGDAPADLPAAFERGHEASARRRAAARTRQARIWTSNEQLNAWIERSSSDLGMMESDTPQGPYPHAGVPWFSTTFGRDGIITAYQLLWNDPALARGVLGFLAANQATSIDPLKDAEPGKILHELRGGEMAALGEVPFDRYYGSIDATPLFVMLAGAYFRRTAELPFLESLWPHVERAVGWMELHGDLDGDGFLEYRRRGPQGLANQGWKDSGDSVFHADGSPAVAPIALCEVQGYAYGARVAAAEIASALGRDADARMLRASARQLRSRFDRAFWCESIATYALALDGEKRPCRVRSSNAGHCLFSRIAPPARARLVARTLMERTSFSGWGIRTIDERERRYNPMSYHNGSVWPHDNALCALGFRHYALKEDAAKVFEALFHAARACELERLPELYCGFPRKAGEGPTLYPVACLPQAWASGAVFMLLSACLGLEMDASREEVRFEDAQLPSFVDWVRIEGLRLGAASVDLLLERHHDGVVIKVLRRDGALRIVATH